ncbi:MAG TPA: lipopolysaccharide biosynthesis protein [Candidatus Polarisedimenticolia bacterium]|nr:lipopolysaccharide biosynthesis protein [Candidatus Polarisedimenticolia bacterium]
MALAGPPPAAGEAGAPGRGLSHSTLSGLFWTFLGTGTQGVLQLGVLIVLARLLTPADFGLVSAAMVVIGFSQIFSQLGVGPAIVQHPGLQPRHLRAGFTLSLLFGAAMTGLVGLGSGLVADFFRIPGLAPVTRLLSVVFVLQGAGVVAESLLLKELRFRRLASVEVAAFGLGFGVVGIGMALAGFGVWSLAGAHLCQSLVKTSGLLLLQPHPMAPSLERAACRDLLWFGGGFTAARIGNYFGVQGDQMVVGRFLGAEALGIYGRAYQLMASPAMFLGQILDRVLFPAMAKVQDRTEDLLAAYRRGVALIALVMLPASAALVVLAPEVVRVLLGPGWEAAVTPFRILALGMLFRTSYKMSDSLARATGAVYRRAWRQWIYAGLVIGGAAAGSAWGVEGVTLCVLAAIGGNFLIMAQLSLSLARMTWREFAAAHAPALLAAALMGGLAWGSAGALRGADLPAAAVLAGTLAALCLFAALLVRYLPDRVLGSEGIWMLRRLASQAPVGGAALRWLARGSG